MREDPIYAQSGVKGIFNTYKGGAIRLIGLIRLIEDVMAGVSVTVHNDLFGDVMIINYLYQSNHKYICK
ncbi:hypothetical protein D7V95_10560 [bacterium J10(2018)]|jgi:hypothetical protein|nr:hypothetical protein D7V95_10560 [bacterium J10(2018)]